MIEDYATRALQSAVAATPKSKPCIRSSINETPNPL